MLESASEYISSARHDFVENRYGTSAHNIYYSMLYSLRALLASLGREHREIEHTPAPKQLATILHDIKTGSSPLLKSHATTASSNLFSDIDSKGIVQAFKDARFLREEADYGTNFEGNAYLTTYSRITLRAAELLGIATMLHDGGVMYTRRRGHKYQLDLVRASRLHSAPTEAEHLVLSGSVMTMGFRMHHFATILFLKYSLRIFPFQKHDKFIMISQDLRDVWFLPDSHEKPAGYAEVNRSNFETEQELLARVFVNRYSSGDVKVQFKSLNNLFDLWFRQDGRFYVSLVDGTSMEGIESSVRAIEGDLSSCCDDVYRSASLLLMR